MIVKLIIILTFSIYAVTVQNNFQATSQFSIQGNTNEQIQVTFPMDYVYSVKLKNQSLPSYLKIIPKRFKLAHVKQSHIDQKNKKNLLDDLRSPFTNQYTLLFKINENIIIFEMPDTFIVLKEDEKEFKKIKEFKINGILSNSHIYAVQQRFIIVKLSDQEIVMINQNVTVKQANPFKTTQTLIIKKVSQSDYIHFICIHNNTLYFLQINTKGLLTIIKSQSLTEKNINLQVSAIQRGQLSKNNQQFFIVDQNKGLYVMIISQLLQVANYPSLLQKQVGCFEVDINIQNHSIQLLLSCTIKGNNNFIYLTYDNDKKACPFLLQKQIPYDQKCNSDKYYFFKNYVISQESQSLDIFVPDHYVKDKIKYKKNWVTLDNINNFILRRDQKRQKLTVYVTKSGIIQRRQLQFQKARLTLNSENRVNQTLFLKFQYECNNDLKKTNQICQQDMLLKINIHNNIVSYIQYKSVNIGLILLLTTALIALIVLCRYKYKQIYKNKYQDLKQLTNPQKCNF